MTVNRTTLLDLPLPVTGTESGTWGDTTNNGLTQYVDIAIAGTLVLSTDADVTLTSTEGDSSATNIGATTAQYAILRWTATGSTTRNITALAQSKTYVVINATGGTQSIVLRGAGPTTGVTIISGEKAHCVWNGSDFVKVSSSAAAGGSNTQVQYNSSGVLAGSSNMTFDGTSLSLKASPNLIFESGGNERGRIVTGTGAFELMAGSTVTPTISLASSVATFTNNPVLSGGTANGVLYLNGSKVATSGSALTFDGTTFTYGAGGSATTNTAFTLNGTDNAAYGTGVLGKRNGTNTWFIGDTAWALGSGTGVINYNYGTAPWIWYLQTGGEQMRLTSTGLGIGTSSFTAKLEVAAGTGIPLILKTASGTATSLILQQTGVRQWSTYLPASSNNFVIRDDSAAQDRLTLDSSGNLGLGVTPSAWGSAYKAMQIGSLSGMSLMGYSGAAEFGNNFYFDTAYRYAASTSASRYTQSGGAHTWYIAPSGTAGNAITFTQAMTLDASGNLGVGATSPTSVAGYKTIETQGSSGGIFQTSASGNTVKARFYSTSTAGYVGTNSNDPFAFITNDTERARIDSSGNLGIGTTSPESRLDVLRAGNTAGGTIMMSGSKTNNSNKYGNLTGAHYTNTTYPAGICAIGVFSTSTDNFVDVGGNVGEQIAANTIRFWTAANTTTYGGTERARIDSSGNLLVGTTDSSPIGNGVKGIVLNGTDARFDINRNGATPVFVGRFTSSGTLIDFYYAGISKGSISTDGTNVAYNTSSDYRLKDNQQPLTGSGAFIDALKPKIWNWKADGSKGVGFIAHEVQEVSPGSVVGTKDAVDADGKPVMQAMEYGSAEFIANIIAELQSLRQRVALLEGN